MTVALGSFFNCKIHQSLRESRRLIIDLVEHARDGFVFDGRTRDKLEFGGLWRLDSRALSGVMRPVGPSLLHVLCSFLCQFPR